MRISHAALAATLLSGAQASSASSLTSSASSSARSLASAAGSSVAAASTGLSERLSSLWDRVKSNLPAAPVQLPLTMPSLSSTSAGSRRAATNLTAQNWEAALAAHPAEPWLVVISGGNVTCGGACAQLDAAWALASAQAVADSRAPNLGYVACENNRLLCATWGAAPGSAWWIEPQRQTLDTGALPPLVSKIINRAKSSVGVKELAQDAATDAAGAVTTTRDVYVVTFNKTTVGADDITRLYRRAEYKTRGEPLEAESALSRHPFNGRLARLGLLKYVGYVYFAVGMVPSWTFIMLLSMTFRMFMSKQNMPKESAANKAERERKEKYTDDGKVRGAPPGDARSAGVI